MKGAVIVSHLQRCRVLNGAASTALAAETGDGKGVNDTGSVEASVPHVPGTAIRLWHNFAAVVLQLWRGQLAPTHLRMQQPVSIRCTF